MVTEVRERRRGRSETRTSGGGGGGGGGSGGLREGHSGRLPRRARGRSEVRGTAAAAETAKSMSSVDQVSIRKFTINYHKWLGKKCC